MAKMKHCYYCAADTTFHTHNGIPKCSRCKKANTHRNNNSRWDRVRFKELKQLYNGILK